MKRYFADLMPFYGDLYAVYDRATEREDSATRFEYALHSMSEKKAFAAAKAMNEAAVFCEVVYADGTHFDICSYEDMIRLRIEIVRGRITAFCYKHNDKLYPIDEFGQSEYDPFPEVDRLLHNLVKEQMKARKLATTE